MSSGTSDTKPAATPDQGMAVCGLASVTKRFPGVVAVDDVTLGFHAGEVHVLLGENGAGKSTIVAMLSGLNRPDEGHVTVNGNPVRLGSPVESLAAGINTVFQHVMLVPTLTVFENLVLGAPWWQRPPRARIESRVSELQKDFGLKVPLDAVTGDLSLGEQQQIEIARALLRDSRVLILDEATSMLSPQGADELGERMRLMAGRGLSVIFITHKLSEAYRFGDRISVLKQGRLVGEIAPDMLRSLNEGSAVNEMLRLMFGTETDPEAKEAKTATRPRGPRILQADGLTTAGEAETMPLRDVSLALYEGEILGVAGIDGNGQKQLAEALAGQRPLISGRIELSERDITLDTVSRRRRAGMRYLTDDRLAEGSVGIFTVADNSVLKDIGAPPFWDFGIERPKRITEHARALIRRFGVRTPSEATPIGHLSGGNIQKLLLGRELSGAARLVIFNKPTYGLDMQNILASRQRIRAIADEGMAVLLISTDLDELIALSDRIVVMDRGEICGTLDNDRTAPQQMRHAIGRLMVSDRANELAA